MPNNEREQGERELKRLTQEHWLRKDTEWYIQNLLEKEVTFAGQQQAPCDVLALLVGFSPEPLLQTIWVYQPKRVVLLFNDDYEGTRGRLMARRYSKWVKLMSKSGLLAHQAKTEAIISPNEITSTWVFHQLREGLLPAQREGQNIVVDITGAKKSMAVGAYLFAAYAGADISYVDFEKYDAQTQRPIGYYCRIGTQPNAYESFGLRDWEQIQQLYDQFAFRGVIKATEGLAVSSYRDGQVEIPVFDEEQKRAIELLHETMIFLEAWESGDFTHAYQLWNGSDGNGLILQEQIRDFPVPPAVQILSQANWPSASQNPDVEKYLRTYREFKRGPAGSKSSLFNQPALVLTYAYDEKEKIGRLIRLNEDYRSAYLRAAGLDEFLLKARIALLWFSDCLLIDHEATSGHDKEEKNFKQVVKATATNMRKFLQKTDPLRKLTFGESKPIPDLPDYWASGGIPHETFTGLRNEAIHTALSVSDKQAKLAYDVVSQGLKDFEEQWLTLSPKIKKFKVQPDKKSWVMLLKSKKEVTYQSWQLSWDQLSEACGLDQFLPKVTS